MIHARHLLFTYIKASIPPGIGTFQLEAHQSLPCSTFSDVVVCHMQSSRTCCALYLVHRRCNRSPASDCWLSLLAVAALKRYTPPARGCTEIVHMQMSHGHLTDTARGVLPQLVVSSQESGVRLVPGKQHKLFSPAPTVGQRQYRPTVSPENAQNCCRPPKVCYFAECHRPSAKPRPKHSYYWGTQFEW